MFKENLHIYRHLKFTSQFDQMDCGPACVRMVASCWGKLWPLAHLRRLAGLSREGVSVAGLRDAFQSIGFDCTAYKLGVDDLATQCPLPCILYWEQNHFVVLTGVRTVRKWLLAGRKVRQFRIANPACGQAWMDEYEMAAHWLSGQEGIVVLAAPDEERAAEHVPPVERHSLSRFARRYVGPHMKSMLVLALCMVIGAVLSMVTPFVTQALVDRGITQKDMHLIGMLLMAQVAIFLGHFSQGIVSNWVALFMGTRINIRLLSDYLQKLLCLPMHFFDTKSMGDYNQRINDHARLQSFVTQGALQTAFSLVSVPVLMVVVGYYSPKILGVYLLFTAISLLWVSHFMQQRKVMDYEQFRLQAQNQNKVLELMSGITEIKLASYEEAKTCRNTRPARCAVNREW